jgi:spore maturation protein CgeB
MERKEANSLNSPRVLVIRDGWSSQLEVPGYCLFKALEGMGVTTTHFCHNLLVNLGPLPRVVNKFYRLFLRGRRDLVDIYASADKALLEAVTAFAPDVIIAVHALYVRGSVLAAIRKALPRVKTVNWFPDNLFYQCDLLLDAIDQYDIFYVKDSYLLEKLRRCGRSNAAYLPEAGSPTLLGAPQDITDEERRRYSSDLLLVGSLNPYRLYMLEALRGLPLKVYGNLHSNEGTTSLGSFFAAQCHKGHEVLGRKARLMWNLAKININPMHPINCVHGTNIRLFELAASGSFQIIEETPDLTAQFTPGTEVATFRTGEELREKSEYYLARPEERQAMAERSYTRLLAEHTYEHRARKMMADLGWG